ncbi:MAG: hypothetical protein KA994_03255 [Brachymonas sp.]|nr:hypothetical protein [Brachymonas sp.]
MRFYASQPQSAIPAQHLPTAPFRVGVGRESIAASKSGKIAASSIHAPCRA